MNGSWAAKYVMLLLCLCFANSSYANLPVVELIQQHDSNTQLVRINNTALLFYTLRNNAPLTFPLTIRKHHALKIQSNTCDHHLRAHSTCTVIFAFTAPPNDQTIKTYVSFDYQSRKPLTAFVEFQVKSAIQCALLPLANFNTSFCQNQYQHVLKATPNVFNPTNENVISNQVPGGMFGIFQRRAKSNFECYVSCGVTALNGPPPDAQTMYEIASLTKVFTTGILGIRIYQGQLQGDTRVESDLPPGFQLNPSMAALTYEQLATFSGGFCFSNAPNVVTTDPVPQMQAEFVADVNMLDRDSPTCLGTGINVRDVYTNKALPTHNTYSNSSVGLIAQALMHKEGYGVTQADFNGWICQNLTRPLDMRNTNACLPSQPDCPQIGNHCNTTTWATLQYATGYANDGSNYTAAPAFTFVPWYGAGNLRSNTIDMVKFIKASLGFADPITPEIKDILAGLNISQHSQLYSPVPAGQTPIPNIPPFPQGSIIGGQGYAWVCDPMSSAPQAICGKEGDHTGFHTYIGLQHSISYGVVILFNANNEGSIDPTHVSNIGQIALRLITQTT